MRCFYPPRGRRAPDIFTLSQNHRRNIYDVCEDKWEFNGSLGALFKPVYRLQKAPELVYTLSF